MNKSVEKHRKFDKLLYMKKLTAAQFTSIQAETIANGTEELGEVIVEQVMHAIDQRDFATKHDVDALANATKHDIELLRNECKSKFV